ncbi:hypothetical protein [Lampropedia aestuarii]|uniref:poly(ethylene terephthalate) hydrolase family protein n=1 Tax=Lampropedia aestuarii TaxID=2562762 RepID=UPI00246875A9|nr:hypothetical protein [Lampropedia aestuarii]MDH5858593.1 hypothetical protein [Lampropedia aestuarii]
MQVQSQLVLKACKRLVLGVALFSAISQAQATSDIPYDGSIQNGMDYSGIESEIIGMEINEDDELLSIEAASLFGNVAIGIANNEYGKLGPYAVKTNAVRGDCQYIIGLIYRFGAKTGITNPNVKCSPQDGFPVATEVWYPSNIRDLGRLPVVNFVGGILSNLGNYDALAELWASHGFIVVNTNDFINVTPLMHAFGAIGVSIEDKKAGSDLEGRVDLSKMIVAGHSAGSAAAVMSSTLPSDAFQVIDDRIKIVATMSIQPSVLTSLAALKIKNPTLYLAAQYDEINNKAGTLAYYKLHPSSQPAWFATARDASHFSPTRELGRNEYAGITTAWLLYQGNNDPAAKKYFVGSGYRLKQDQQFVLVPSNIFDRLDLKKYEVQRNSAANNLR